MTAARVIGADKYNLLWNSRRGGGGGGGGEGGPGAQRLGKICRLLYLLELNLH